MERKTKWPVIEYLIDPGKKYFIGQRLPFGVVVSIGERLNPSTNNKRLEAGVCDSRSVNFCAQCPKKRGCDYPATA